MDPLTTGIITGLSLVAPKIAEKALEKLISDGVDKTWSGREKLAAIFRKYAYDEIQTLDLSEKYTPDKKTIRGEVEKLSYFLQRNEEALREIADLLGESLTPNFGEFNQYRELENYRQKLKEKFTSETDDLKQLRISAEIEAVTKQLEQVKKTILDFAETITKIPNPSEKQIEARELFFTGDLDSARMLLEDSREEMQGLKILALAAKDRNEAEAINIGAVLEQTANDYLLLAQSTAANFNNPNRLEDTCGYFEDSIECFASPESLFAYAGFLQDHNQHPQAIDLYRKIKDELREVISEGNYAATLNNLGILHAETQESGPAEKEFGEALAIYRRLAEANPAAYQSDVAMTLNNLANLHQNTQEFDEVEKEYIEALVIYRRLAEANPAAYEPKVAMTLNNLGVLHAETQEFAAAEKEYGEALAIRQRLAEANPAAYQPDVAMTLNNLGLLHAETQEFEAAEKEYGEALVIYRRLAEANPAAYQPDVAITLNNLGILYKNTQEFEAAEKEYGEALAISRRLAKANPAAYEPIMVTTLVNMALLYLNGKPNRDRSIELAREAIVIITPYVERAPYTRRYLEIAEAVLAAWEDG